MKMPDLPDEQKSDSVDKAESEEDSAFVISVSQRGTRSTLHRRAGCWRARRFSFTDYELVAGPREPVAHLHGGRCKDCFWEDNHRDASC